MLSAASLQGELPATSGRWRIKHESNPYGNSFGALSLSILAGYSTWNASESIIGTYLSGHATQSSWAVRTVGLASSGGILHHPHLRPILNKPQRYIFSQQQIQSIKAAFSQISAYQKILNDSVDFGIVGCAGLFFGLIVMTRDRVEYVQRVVRTTVIRIRRES